MATVCYHIQKLCEQLVTEYTIKHIRNGRHKYTQTPQTSTMTNLIYCFDWLHFHVSSSISFVFYFFFYLVYWPIIFSQPKIEWSIDVDSMPSPSNSQRLEVFNANDVEMRLINFIYKFVDCKWKIMSINFRWIFLLTFHRSVYYSSAGTDVDVIYDLGKFYESHNRCAITRWLFENDVRMLSTSFFMADEWSICHFFFFCWFFH